MSVDNITEGYKSPVLVATANQSEAKNNKPFITDRETIITDKLSILKAKITRVFTHRDNNTPAETFQQLASLETASNDTSETDDDTISMFDPNAVEKIKNYEATQKLSQQIKDEAIKSFEDQPVTETLFPDQPSLYEQHYQEYKKEKKTIKGAITRLRDIRSLKKEKISDTNNIYDSLRSRGISRQDIMINLSRSVDPSGNLFPNEKDKHDFYRQHIWYDKGLIAGLDRLYKIGEFDPKLFAPQDGKQLYDLITNLSNVTFVEEDKFNQTFNRINRLTLLADFKNKSKLFNSFSWEIPLLTVEYFQDNYCQELNDPNNNNLKSLLEEAVDYHAHGQTSVRLFEKLINSDITPDKKIIIPDHLKEKYEYGTGFSLDYHSNLSNRQEQVFLSNTRSDPNEGDFRRLFDQNNQPNLHFYNRFILKSENDSKPIAIPDRIIDRGIFYELISSIDDISFQKCMLTLSNDPNNWSFYLEHPQKTEELERYLKQQPATSSISELKLEQFATLFIKDNQITPFFLKNLIIFGVDPKQIRDNYINPGVLDSFSPQDQKLWNQILSSNYDQWIASFFFTHENIDKYLNPQDGSFNDNFYKEFSTLYPHRFVEVLDKSGWQSAFGKEMVDELLTVLPKHTDEKRNAFTHNNYDRTSQFFSFLVDNPQTGFKLDKEHFKVVTEYIKNYGLSKSVLFYSYFQTLSLYEQGVITNLPQEFVNSQVTSLKELRQKIKNIQKLCFDTKFEADISNLSTLELNLLSVATGHSSNRWTRIPIETIVSSFSQDSTAGLIAEISPEFSAESTKTSFIKVETDKKITDSPKLMLLKEEILSAINNPYDSSQEKGVILEMLRDKISLLTKDIDETNQVKSKKQEYIEKQLNIFRQKLEEISVSNSPDNLLANMVTLNFGSGNDQEKFKSVLRQLVFKKVFDKHRDSPGWQESLKVSLENETATVDAVNNTLNLLNNTIKDHALNFETQNQDKYWDDSTFETMKKFSSVFKKNLSLSVFINQLNSYKESFNVIKTSQNETIKMIPDRGLIGEMSGYLADVCYTKVYPLLKQYPDLVPYKFVANPESDNPEFIGSTLVFKIKDADDQPVFLIRAFNIPNEQSIDVGNFFESFVDHLTPIAEKMKIKKIIVAGPSGAVSNYSIITNYVNSRYVTGKENVALKDNFDFNYHNITNQCYLVRDISSAEMPGNEPGSESRL